MKKNRSREIAEKILSTADIQIDGQRPWDIQVHDERFYNRVLGQGSMGLGESYMEGWWDCEKLDEFFTRLLQAELEKQVIKDWKTILWIIGQVAFNKQKKSRAFKIGKHHYDIGNDLYDLMLDKRKVYTCGYWKNASTLDEAQEAKLNMVCQKLDLKPGQRILDIGCGWGSFAKFAAEKYGVNVVGVTVSEEQIKLGNELCQGLPVELLYKDYRDIEGEFDHIVSLGMFEHVGYKNYRTYMQIAHKHLKNGGLFLLHTIGKNYTVNSTDPWIEKYIFPNSMIPSAKQVTTATEKLFVIEDWQNFGADYNLTLLAWFSNFDKNWEKIKNNYDNYFYRMWKYYLLVCAGAFRSRKLSLWQIVLLKGDLEKRYDAFR